MYQDTRGTMFEEAPLVGCPRGERSDHHRMRLVAIFCRGFLPKLNIRLSYSLFGSEVPGIPAKERGTNGQARPLLEGVSFPWQVAGALLGLATQTSSAGHPFVGI